MLFRQLFDAESSTFTYLVADEGAREAVLIDSVREQVERDLQPVRALDLRLPEPRMIREAVPANRARGVEPKAVQG